MIIKNVNLKNIKSQLGEVKHKVEVKGEQFNVAFSLLKYDVTFESDDENFGGIVFYSVDSEIGDPADIRTTFEVSHGLLEVNLKKGIVEKAMGIKGFKEDDDQLEFMDEDEDEDEEDDDWDDEDEDEDD